MTRRVVYGGLAIGAALVGLWVWYLSATVDHAATETEARIVQREKDTAVLVKQLTERRLAREAAERAEVAQAIATSAQSSSANVAQPQGKLCNFARKHNDPSRIDVLVNKKHCLVPLSYAPKTVTVGSAVLSPLAASDYRKMIAAAAEAGHSLRASSSYRSFADQVSTYRYWLEYTDSISETNAVSAMPGYSEHQTGLTVDLAVGGCVLDCLTKHAAYPWLTQHAHEYGFIERYPLGKEEITGYSHESWHYRYVGVETASDMKRSGIQTLEEYWEMLGGVYD